MIRFDDYAFENAAQAIYIMNESARDQYNSWEELHEFMISIANIHAFRKDTTCFSTGGFVLTFVRSADVCSPDGSVVWITASVQSYMVARYAEKVNKQLNSIRELAA